MLKCWGLYLNLAPLGVVRAENGEESVGSYSFRLLSGATQLNVIIVKLLSLSRLKMSGTTFVFTRKVSWGGG